MKKYTIYLELNGSKFKFSNIIAIDKENAAMVVLDKLKSKLTIKTVSPESIFENGKFEKARRFDQLEKLKNIFKMK